MNIAFDLCTLSQPPRGAVRPGPSVSDLLFQCLPGSLASQLLVDVDFEPYVGFDHRKLSAISIESVVQSGYYLEHLAAKKTFFAPHSFPLFSSRAANAALCISFFCQIGSQKNKRLMSLILNNEFQMPFGVYDHASRRFLIYTQQALPEAETFFEHEKGPELLQHLIQLEESGLLESYVNRTNLRPAIHFGFNRSFGHTHWNDVLGLLHLRQSSISSRIPKNLTTLQGPYAWVDPKLLTPEPRYKFDSVPELTEHVLKEGLSVQVPLGFSIDQKYVDFWKNEVSALAQPDRWGVIREMRRKCSPIIAFNIRFGEIWRRGWKDCFVQLPQIISALHVHYPNLGIVLDGLTSYHTESNDNAGSLTSNLPEGFLDAMPVGVPVVDISGQSIGLKTAAYSAVDYAISQFGSGETIPAWVYALPWISISAEPDIVASYGSSNNITRQCKPAIQDTKRHGTFLPIDHLVIESDGYSIRLSESVEFILSHMQHCGFSALEKCMSSSGSKINQFFSQNFTEIGLSPEIVSKDKSVEIIFSEIVDEGGAFENALCGLVNIPLQPHFRREVERDLRQPAVHSLYKLNDPGIYVYTWPNGETASFIFTKNGLLLQADDYWLKFFPFIVKHSNWYRLNASINEQDIITSEEDFVWCYDTANFSHFLVDALAPLAFFSKKFPDLKKQPIPQFSRTPSWQDEYMQVFGEKRFYLPSERALGQAAFVVFRPKSLMLPVITSTLSRTLAIREFVRDRWGNPEPIFGLDRFPIYLTRNDHRAARVRNSKEIQGLVADLGGFTVDPSKLNSQQKLELFNLPGIFIAEGSGTMNVCVFSNSNARLISLTDPEVLKQESFIRGGWPYMHAISNRMNCVLGKDTQKLTCSPLSSCIYDSKLISKMISEL